MIGLIRKDLYLNRKTILPFLCMCILYAVIMIIACVYMRGTMNQEQFSKAVQSFSIINAMLFYLSVFSVQSIYVQTDLGKKTRYYFCASPVGIKGFVASKYYGGFLLAFATFLYCELYDLILSAIGGDLLNNSLIHLVLLFWCMAMQCLALPFLIGFGKHGTYIRTAIVLLIIGCAIVYALFGDISAFMKEGGIISVMQNILANSDNESLMAWILGKGYSALVLLLLLPHLFVLLVYVSYLASCALFRRGATTYEA